MTLRLNGNTGYTEIAAPASAGSNTLVLPTGNGSADQALVTNGSGTLSFADRGRMVLETAKAFNWNGLTTNEIIDFENIPSYVKRITVMFNGVSTNGTSPFLIQLGAGSIAITGYVSQSCITAGSNVQITSTAGLVVVQPLAADSYHGIVHIATLGSNFWSSNGVVASSTAGRITHSAGTSTALSGTLDRIRITTVAAGATNQFDAGTINIMYEG